MPSRTTIADGVDAAAGDTLAPFAIEQSGEVAAWLHQLEDRAIPVNLSSASGAGVLTTIWSVDAAGLRLAFEAAPGSTALADLVESDEVTAVAYLDQVKLQFDLEDLVLVRGASSSAVQARLAGRLYRFQRRGAFRVPALAHLVPSVELRHPALPDMRLALRVLDVSAGGCALLLPADVPRFAAGITISGARVRLDADTAFDAALQVLHVNSIQPGALGVRLGCALVGLPVAAACTLQRYVDRTQRRRRPFGG